MGNCQSRELEPVRARSTHKILNSPIGARAATEQFGSSHLQKRWNMDDEKAGGTDCDGRPAAGLAPGTFKPCGVMPTTRAARIEASELMAIAGLLGPEYVQTAWLFGWATGATDQAEITGEEIERFGSVLSVISYRFGTNVVHFDLAPDEVVAIARRTGPRPRDRSTISRHRHRLARLRDASRPRFENRVDPNGWITLDADEALRIAGWDAHRGFLLIERLGVVRHGTHLKTVDLMLEPSASAKALARLLVQEAEQVRADLQERGRAFVVTRHGGRILIIRPFWDA